ncbi:MAG: tRNA (adenosine(37)-N6)-threonylcarbamoyltransferase complex ATPase subunit type 1 TsaE [Candidatus Delongbacteria bacterium]
MEKLAEKIVSETISEEDTENFARDFARSVKEGDIICFFGDVGAGKTVFTRGLCRGLGFKGYVNSPSYIIMNMYENDGMNIYHFDLYRIGSSPELTEIGFYDFIYSKNSVSIVEWADMIKDCLPEKRIDVFISVTGENTRKFEITRHG